MTVQTNPEALQNIVIFKNFSIDGIKAALDLLHATSRQYKKSEIILHAGSTTREMGLVLKGSVTIENNDAWGNKSILSHVGKGHFFAETYAYIGTEPLMVDVTANEDCSILFLKIGALQELVSEKNPWAVKLTMNLLTIFSQKNLALSGRSFHISPKTIRGRVMAYLNSLYIKKGTSTFDIPFDRQQMADYLNLDRTALSKELGRMRDEGLISFHKNCFTIL